MRTVFIPVAFAISVGWLAWSSRPAHAPAAQARIERAVSIPADRLYDHDPDHLWNRVDRALRVRVAGDGAAFGADALDPLLWHETRHMLTPPSHAATVAVLDEFLDSHAERLVSDPVRRVILQRDLWAAFDWAVASPLDFGGPRHALAGRLVRLIRRVALAPHEAEGLPDSYTATVASGRYPTAHDPSNSEKAFLPPALLESSGAWVDIHGDVPLPQHSDEMSRSAFGLYLALPGGRRATLEYLKKLWSAAEPFVVDESVRGELRTTINPVLRPIPPGTQIALVRTMMLVDRTGVIRRTALVESVQLRVFREPRLPRNAQGGHNDQDFYEFVLSRAGLFTSPAFGVRAIERSEEAFLTFSSHGIDPFEHQPSSPTRTNRTLEMCVACHHERGLASVGSAARLFKPYVFVENGGSNLDGMPEYWKTRRADWGYLQALWHAEPW